jgi:hypothetical protein
MNNGFVKLYRCTEDSFFWNDSQAVHLWIQLLLSANHKDKEMLLSGKKIIIKSGQFACSRSTLSLKTGIKESKVQRLLKLFENEQQIEQQMNSRCRIITILNWQKYQSGEQVIEQQMNNTRTTDEQQMNTNKNEKNEKNEKKEEKENIKEKEDDIPTLFEDPYSFESVFKMYGKKGNRKTAEPKWNKLTKEKKRLAVERIPAYVRSTPDIQFRKNFETYINKESWNDKIISNKCKADEKYIEQLKKRGFA